MSRTGNTAGAVAANNSARQFVKISIIVGIITYLLLVGIVIAVIVINTRALTSTLNSVHKNYNIDNSY